MKKGFTLAEVLITLGIIGVVAALTMPSLIANYKKQVYVTQLRKSVSAWEQGMKLMLATDGVDEIADTEFARVLRDAGYGAYIGSSAQAVPQADEILKKYFNIIKIEDAAQYTSKGMDGSTGAYSPGYRKVYMADGSVYYIYIYVDGRSSTNLGNRVVDVNGDKGPNIDGRDVFYFNVDPKGSLIPYNSQQANEQLGSTYWRDDPTLCGTPGSADMTGVKGQACAARIIENGWVMDY